jgi:hypothetical protein
MVAVDTGAFEDRFEAPDSRWNSNYGGAGVVGGLGRIPCEHLGGVSQDAGFQSTSPGGSDIWTLALSHVYAKLVAVPVGSGATSAWCQLAILSVTGGTYLSILYDAIGGILSLTSRVGWSDPGAVYLTYDANDHRWLRIRNSAGSVLWETSPDGITWTTRRTLVPAPAWIATDAVSILINCARDGGTNDYAEWDNLNITPVQPAGPVAAVATVGAPGLSTSSTVIPASPVAAVATVGVPGFAYIPLPALCASATTRGLVGVATTATRGGTAATRGLTGMAVVKGGTACPP